VKARIKPVLKRFSHTIAFYRREHPLFLYAALLIWIKTWLVQRFMFQLPVKGPYQELILLLTPASSTLLLLAVSLVAAGKRQRGAVLAVSAITSLVLLANMVYYRFFHDFITLPVLFQGSNAGDLGASILSLLSPWDALVFADTAVIAWLAWSRKTRLGPLAGKRLRAVAITAVILFLVNWGLAETVRPQIMTRTFDRQIVVKSIGLYNYHVYDLVSSTKMQTKKVLASEADAEAVADYAHQGAGDLANPNMFGIARGRNVFVISLESLQSFVIGSTVEGQEITPFLNDLIGESFYFENFYHQTGQGKTSDAEFLVDNSLYPLPSGAVFFTHANNTYRATPQVLAEYGYHSAVFHANDKTFWNRDLMYQSLGYDQFFDVTYYELNEYNQVGWGLKDIDFFEQSMPLLRQLPQPFYTKWITLTNHHPFVLDEADRLLPPYPESGLLDRYFQTARYLDEALKRFFEQLRKEGLYENSIFILYGDHYGISSFYHRLVAKYLGMEEITPFDAIQLQRVPLIIHIPGVEGRTMNTVAGQIDVKPTLLHLLGIEDEQSIDFGHDLFSLNKPELVVLRDGSFITAGNVYTQNACYEKATGQEAANPETCLWFLERAETELKHSDDIIYGDLLRFLLKEEPAEGAEEAEGSEAEPSWEEGRAAERQMSPEDDLVRQAQHAREAAAGDLDAGENEFDRQEADEKDAEILLSMVK